MVLSTNSISDEYQMETSVNKTFFRSLNNTVIVTQVGSIVQVPCRAHLIGDEMVRVSSPESFAEANCFNYSFIISFRLTSLFSPFIRSLTFITRTRKVSWIRRKDYHLLTVGLTKYSSDERFSVIHYDESEVNEAKES
jgi:hypothetical protein